MARNDIILTKMVGICSPVAQASKPAPSRGEGCLTGRGGARLSGVGLGGIWRRSQTAATGAGGARQGRVVFAMKPLARPCRLTA